MIGASGTSRGTRAEERDTEEQERGEELEERSGQFLCTSLPPQIRSIRRNGSWQSEVGRREGERGKILWFRGRHVTRGGQSWHPGEKGTIGISFHVLFYSNCDPNVVNHLWTCFCFDSNQLNIWNCFVFVKNMVGIGGLPTNRKTLKLTFLEY